MKRGLFLFIVLFFFPSNQSHAQIVKVEDPYTYTSLNEDIEEINEKYHHFIQTISIGKSTLGNEILAVKIGKGERNIVFIGAHHGREWMTTNLLMMMIEQYAEAYSNKRSFGPYDTSIFNEISIWFLPQLNPDGVMIQQGMLHQIPPIWQEYVTFLNHGLNDFSEWKANATGIDLNRQYPAGWKKVPSPKEPGPKYYKGDQPFQAVEIKQLVKFIENVRPEIAVSYHTTGQVIFWKYGKDQNIKRDFPIAKKLSDITNYPLAIPAKQAYGSGFTDWFITYYKKPGFTIEIGRMNGEKPPPIKELKNEWERNKYVGLFLAFEAKKLKKQ